MGSLPSTCPVQVSGWPGAVLGSGFQSVLFSEGSKVPGVLEGSGWGRVGVMITFLNLRHMLEVMSTTTALNAFVQQMVLQNER